ncbi:hypothetical protein SK128_013117 [Halocaridina rubra]|uniref:Uncharacterized protein n=1 Tax=Halocaridina rubra TaxID=373956 RepID=A0AAN8XAH9_HALRR
MCFRLCCDPHKLAYISALVTAGEAVLFGVINLTLILMKACVIIPPEDLGAGLDKFWAWYYFDNETCASRHEDLSLPDWVNKYSEYPLEDRPDRTSVEANYQYQITYLALHACWILSAPILIYGNARKRWGFYIPWLLVSLTLLVMDVVIAAFFIKDMTEVDSVKFSDGVGPMIWSFSLYLRGYLFWFTNAAQTATVINAFCKSRHKRVKQERQRKKQQKKHEIEMANATAAATAKARAEAQAESDAQKAQAKTAEQKAQSSQSQPVVQQVHVEHHHHGIENAAYVGVNEDPYARRHHSSYPSLPEDSPPYSQQRNPRKNKAPKEVRPFSYLNPSFRPNAPGDLIGMKQNKAPAVPESGASSRGQGYFTALPPRDYDDDDDDIKKPLPHINYGRDEGSYHPSAPRDKDFPPPYEQHQGGTGLSTNTPPYRSNNYY